MLQSENARYIYSPMHLKTLILCTQHACPPTPKHVHIMHATYLHTPPQTRLYCARYIHAPPTLIFACCARYIHAHIYTTCAYCACYMHAQTHPNFRMLCTIDICTNLHKHAHIVHATYMHQPTLTFARCARYIHAHIYPTHAPRA